ncbi:unnamed protein product [Adineta ricciae]|uniref:Uncharacterized protein n=1 Tax=Adineta ricciae TaxID=249248 RepID=A0A814SFE9_ADIRI|nr:unnamed protein product [Adineta ricciae]CAF1460734.1 unnamed protein product [Adineta ricciae]
MMISNSFPLNQWTHLLQRYDPSSGIDFYINGTLIMSNASLSTRSPVGSDVFLGSSPTNTASCQRGSIGMGQFVGAIDKFYIFSQAATPNDICHLSNF